LILALLKKHILKSTSNCEISKSGFSLLFVLITMFFIFIAISICSLAIKNTLNTDNVIKTNANHLMACEKALNDTLLKLSEDPEYSGGELVENSIPVKVVVFDIGQYKRIIVSSPDKNIEILAEKQFSVPRYALAVRNRLSTTGNVRVVTKYSDKATPGILINYGGDSYPNIFFITSADGLSNPSEPIKINLDESSPFWQEYIKGLQNLPSGFVVNYLDPANSAPILNSLNCNQTYLVPVRLGTNLKINNLQDNCKITFSSDVSSYKDLLLPSNANFDFNGQLFVNGNLILESKEVNIKNGLNVLGDLNLSNSNNLKVGGSLFVLKNSNLQSSSKLTVNNGAQIKGDFLDDKGCVVNINKALNVEGGTKIYGQLIANNSQINFNNVYILNGALVDASGSNVYVNRTLNIDGSDISQGGSIKSSSLYVDSLNIGPYQSVNSTITVFNSANVSGNIFGSLLVLNEEPDSNATFNDGSNIFYLDPPENWFGPPLGLKFVMVKGSWREF